MPVSCNCKEGKCSNCGECCTEMLPLTLSEVRLIKAYVKEKNIKPYSDIFFLYENKLSCNMMCPFRDFTEKKCRIYEVRPKICRLFKCNQDANTIESHKLAAHKRANYNKCVNPRKHVTKAYSTRELIYGDKIDTIRVIVGNLARMNKPIFTEGVINLLKAFDREDLCDVDLVNKVLDEYEYMTKLAEGGNDEHR